MNVSKNITDPLVSIVTPCFNAEKTLAVTIESILNQTYRNLELIIIDDCSLDSSLQVANSFMSIDPRIKVLKLDYNSGVAKARNKGIDAGSGQLLPFCDADDIWYPTN
jgi:teichuronic acid biosynthesis glycosyltransferase TuaG